MRHRQGCSLLVPASTPVEPTATGIRYGIRAAVTRELGVVFLAARAVFDGVILFPAGGHGRLALVFFSFLNSGRFSTSGREGLANLPDFSPSTELEVMFGLGC